MLIPMILTLLLVFSLILASFFDLKTREVPDWISFTLIPLAILLRIAQSILEKSITPILTTFLTFLIFFFLALGLYYIRQWGGGDAKMFMAIGACLPQYPSSLLHTLSPNLNLPFPAILFVNILIGGSVYGIFYFLFLSARNHIKINLGKKIRIITFVIVLSLLALCWLSPPVVRLQVLLLAFLIAIFPYTAKLSTVIQKKCLIKNIPLSRVTEGDWIAEDILKGKKILIKHTTPGLTLDDLKLLRRNRIKSVKVRYGIPFIPSFLIGVLLSLFFGNLFLF